MNSSFDWSKYNADRNKEAVKINKFNLSSNFNYSEKGIYNHIRDVYALSLTISKGKKKTKVLDYGGGLISQSNLINKISLKNYNFTIYNPYIKKIKKKFLFNYSATDNIKKLNKEKFDLIYFGSCLQYVKNAELLIKLNFIVKSKFILITHTPLSFDAKSFVHEKQKNQKNLSQKIYTYDFIKKKLLKNKFTLIFKSTNDFKYSGLQKKKNHIKSMNLLFKKN